MNVRYESKIHVLETKICMVKILSVLILSKYEPYEGFYTEIFQIYGMPFASITLYEIQIAT